jgi:hypothetical protein
MLALVQELPLVFVLTVLPLTIQSTSQATNLLPDPNLIILKLFNNDIAFNLISSGATGDPNS